jgi:hypothetical protein
MTSLKVPLVVARRAEQYCARGNFIEGVEVMLMRNMFKESVLELPGNGQKDVSALLKQAMGYLHRDPFYTVNTHPTSNPLFDQLCCFVVPPLSPSPISLLLLLQLHVPSHSLTQSLTNLLTLILRSSTQLGVSIDAETVDIRKAYKKLALK